MDFTELSKIAEKLAYPRALSESAEAGSVAAALLTEEGHVYTGVCIDTPCSMGFCAEHAGGAAMGAAGGGPVVKLGARKGAGGPVPPRGRCRELLYQLNHENLACEVLLPGGVKTLAQLLPDRWN